jgi:hypothetical protein
MASEPLVIHCQGHRMVCPRVIRLDTNNRARLKRFTYARRFRGWTRVVTWYCPRCTRLRRQYP